MKRLLYLLPLLFSLVASPAFAAAIAHTFVQQNTQQSTTSTTYVDVTGAAIASGNFTTGKKYLLYITVQITENASGFMWMQTLHGSTPFAESEAQMGASSTNLFYSTYTFMTVWTAVASEGIKLQFKVSGTTPTVFADYSSLLAINLTDDVVEDIDWKYAELATDEALSTTPDDGASVTITPSGASDWLVLTYAQHDGDGGAQSTTSRIVRSGEASSTFPHGTMDLSNAALLYPYGLSRVFALTAASNTFKEQSESSGVAHTRLHSNVFILNLNKFAVHSSVYTEAETALSDTDYATQLQTASITPTVTGDVLIGTNWVFDMNNTGREAQFRIQVDNSDQPAGQTTSASFFNHTGAIATDELPLVLSTMLNLSNAAHTIDLDASVDLTTGAPAGQEMSIWAVTMELASAAGGTAGPLRRRLQ